MSVDPVIGGTANPYVYVGDPVNMEDYSGLFGLSSIGNAFKKAGNFIGEHADGIGTAIVAGSFVACVVATAGICAGVTAASIAIGGALTTARARYNGDGWAKAVSKGIVSIGIDIAFTKIDLGKRALSYAANNMDRPWVTKGITEGTRYFGSISNSGTTRNYTSTAKALNTEAGKWRTGYQGFNFISNITSDQLKGGALRVW